MGFGSEKSRATIRCFAAVAQLDRVLGYEPRGRGFDSCQPHQISIFSRLEHSLEAYAPRLFFFVQTDIESTY